MKDSILLELARRWDQEAATPLVQDGSPEAQLGNALAKGRREGKRECADALRILIELLGSKRHDGD